MTLVHKENGYLFYIGFDTMRGGFRRFIFNIIKEPQTREEKISFKEPTGGFPNRRYIERIKGIKFPDKYQPTLHGMGETYLSDEWSGI